MNDQPESTSALAFMVRALRSRNYRLFFGGQFVSLVGNWLSMVATSWLVYRLARENQEEAEWILGRVGFASQLPVLLLSPMAGVLVERWHRHTVLVCTQSLAMLQSFLLAALALSDLITIGQLMALGAFQGVINAFDLPARQAFSVELVDRREDLSNAIALNSSMFHGARMIGPAVAGMLIYFTSEGMCFLLDGFSYLAVLASLLAMRIVKRERTPVTAHPLESLREGLRYSFGFPPIRTLLLLIAVTSLSVMSQATLMPIFAGEILHGDALTLGWLSAAAGTGALGGSLYLASRRSVVGLGRVIAIACTTLGLGMIAFSMSRWLFLSLPILVVTGASLVIEMAAANTMLQTIVDDDKRSRVMALFTMAFFGVAPFGSLLAGKIGAQIGAPNTLALAGGVALLTALVFTLNLPALRRLVRPVYQTKGILPQIAEGLKSAEVVSNVPQD